jgi:hypothetical protein
MLVKLTPGQCDAIRIGAVSIGNRGGQGKNSHHRRPSGRKRPTLALLTPAVNVNLCFSMYNRLQRTWKSFKTQGVCPPYTSGATAVVYHNELFVFFGFYHYTNDSTNSNDDDLVRHSSGSRTLIHYVSKARLAPRAFNWYLGQTIVDSKHFRIPI